VISNYESAFNARWLTPQEVARQFVPIIQFHKLAHSRHSLLLGPRGSGKTTLLKMLTRPALRVWREERSTDGEIPEPNFEAIYIPSDVRWSQELRCLDHELILGQLNAELSQRALVASSTLIAFCDSLEYLLPERPDLKRTIYSALIDIWGIRSAIPTVHNVRASASSLASRIRGAVNRGDRERLERIIQELPDQVLGHALDCPINTCNALQQLAPEITPTGKWALCYDELEISPSWLRREVLEGYRSVTQNIFLKLTFSPLLPSGLRSVPEPGHDYQKVRLWSSHIEDARAFCEDLSRQFLESRFPGLDVTPEGFLGYSALAADEAVIDDDRSYSRDSSLYREMRALAKDDSGFRAALVARKVDPEDPFTESVALRDAFFRKIKPVVILRRAFRSAGHQRSRKVPTAYAGRQAIYAMSEGNPRWLLELLTDLHDTWKVSRATDAEGRPKIGPSEQARVLNAAARRFHTSLTAAASPDVEVDGRFTLTLSTLIDGIGESFSRSMLGSEFPTDPTGSFVVDAPITAQLTQVLEKALEMGAIVYVGKSQDDVPRSLVGSRFRLTFMLSPIYRLPFRNYRSVDLGALLQRAHPDQTDLFAGASSGKEQ
jgi:hypothetical protein